MSDYVRCICRPDATGEAPDERPDCPQHGEAASEARTVNSTDTDPFA